MDRKEKANSSHPKRFQIYSRWQYKLIQLFYNKGLNYKIFERIPTLQPVISMPYRGCRLFEFRHP